MELTPEHVTTIAALVGILASWATTALTHVSAPRWIKSTLAVILSALGGALVTVTVAPGETWQVWVADVGAAWLVAVVTHVAGGTAWIGRLTAAWGIGRRLAPTPVADAVDAALGGARPTVSASDAGTTWAASAAMSDTPSQTAATLKVIGKDPPGI